MLPKCKNVWILHILTTTKTLINACKIVHIYKNATITMHVCTVTIALHLIFYFFSLPFTSLSLFLSSASHSHLTDLRSKLTLVVPPPKLTHQSDLRSSLAKTLTVPLLIARWSSIWSVGFWVLTLFYSLFEQFWDSLFDQWVLGFWSFFILCLISG